MSIHRSLANASFIIGNDSAKIGFLEDSYTQSNPDKNVAVLNISHYFIISTIIAVTGYKLFIFPHIVSNSEK